MSGENFKKGSMLNHIMKEAFSIYGKIENFVMKGNYPPLPQ